ncbi:MULTISPECIES: glycosyltransferase [Acidianus]|uniref:Glycogen synthase n=1 Tax=Candidatus Acidianus copahuensis TaxID=1160895 RepID=A0A031LKK3_9CREN|nr:MULTISPECIES: glycosyltransferase [Acidianus]EZQ01744.1 glycogen synthase [Candidatus Acidianus copahuensis]NON63575.1 glycosyltransferase [Acidianus sp. RZ1]
MKRIESLWLPEKVDSVWLLTFELLKVASMGGLGNAVYNLGKELANQGIKVTVLMPSHGRHMSDYYRKSMNLRDSGLSFFGVRKGLDGGTYPYRLGFEIGDLDGMRIMIAKGLDYNTGKIIDSWNLYENTMEKASLFARAIEGYIQVMQFDNVPSIIHVNDWHSVIAGVKAKLSFEQRRLIVPLIYTIHLLNRVGAPWHYASQDWSGLEDYPHYVWMVSKHVLYGTRTLWDYCEGKIEKFGCYEADLIASVSRNYLSYDVFSYVGNFMENKGCVTYNGTDWDVNTVKDFSSKFLGTINRSEGRKKMYSFLPNIKVVPNDYASGNMLWNNRSRIGIRDDWTYEPLGDGPLVLFTGRIIYQKGIDILLRAFKDVVRDIWNARLIVLGIPTDDYGLLQDVIDRAAEVRDNVRLIIGSTPSLDIYKLFHYISSVFVAPSRWEPFGINAIEAMAVGLPVVAFTVGGLAESVIDLRWSTSNGTGFLVEPESISSLANALKTSIYLSLADETENRDLLNKAQLLKVDDVKFWEKVRQNSISRVNSEFRWSKVGKSALECYNKALNMARYRALAYM